MKMHRLQHDFSQAAPHSPGRKQAEKSFALGKAMMIEMRTKRRWIVSVLEAVAEGADDRVASRVHLRQNTARRQNPGQKGFAMRLKAATRPLADAAR
jgi:hypothetical protein